MSIAATLAANARRKPTGGEVTAVVVAILVALVVILAVLAAYIGIPLLLGLLFFPALGLAPFLTGVLVVAGVVVWGIVLGAISRIARK